MTLEALKARLRAAAQGNFHPGVQAIFADCADELDAAHRELSAQILTLPAFVLPGQAGWWVSRDAVLRLIGEGK